MSEQQVLPPMEWTLDDCNAAIREKGNTALAFAIAQKIVREREAQLSTLLASLAQSEAERERLQREQDIAKAMGVRGPELLAEAREELARGRELNQGLRQVVKEYQTTLWHGTYCGHYYGHDPCSICIKAAALLEDESKPVVTNTEDGTA